MATYKPNKGFSLEIDNSIPYDGVSLSNPETVQWTGTIHLGDIEMPSMYYQPNKNVELIYEQPKNGIPAKIAQWVYFHSTTRYIKNIAKRFGFKPRTFKNTIIGYGVDNSDGEIVMRVQLGDED